MGGGHIGLQRFVHVQCYFQALPTKLVFAYFDRGSYDHDITSGQESGVFGVGRGTVLQIQRKHNRQSCNTKCPWSVASLSSQLPSCKLVFLEAFLPCTTNGAWHTQSTSRQLHPKNYDGQYTHDPFPKGIVELAGFILVC